MLRREAALILTSIYCNIYESIKLISAHRIIMNCIVLLIYLPLWLVVLAVMVQGVGEDVTGEGTGMVVLE